MVFTNYQSQHEFIDVYNFVVKKIYQVTEDVRPDIEALLYAIYYLDKNNISLYSSNRIVQPTAVAINRISRYDDYDEFESKIVWDLTEIIRHYSDIGEDESYVPFLIWRYGAKEEKFYRSKRGE